MTTAIAFANPDEQDGAGNQWLNPQTVNGWPMPAAGGRGTPFMGSQVQQEWHPPMAATPATRQEGSSDIAFLRSELRRLGREIGQSGDWEGRAYSSFMEKIDVLDGHLDTLDRNRVGTGETLKTTAFGYRCVIGFCDAVAAVLQVLSMRVIATRGMGPQALLNETATMRFVYQMNKTASEVLSKHQTFVRRATIGLIAAGVLYNQFAKDLPGLQAVSASTPNLMEASTMWDPTNADIVDSPESQFDSSQINQGILPEVGF
ncbi:hypothetical protein ABZ897_17175 [Nonomuraea sp. NPDC046802]|uniref:hypothetical protein n=1 Tax=Nonomuraea sp. NPDC046802 TaxID=3154919 RepID=UPI0033DF16FF